MTTLNQIIEEELKKFEEEFIRFKEKKERMFDVHKLYSASLTRVALAMKDAMVVEGGIKWMQEGMKKDRKGFTDGFNSARTQSLNQAEKFLETLPLN